MNNRWITRTTAVLTLASCAVLAHPVQGPAVAVPTEHGSNADIPIGRHLDTDGSMNRITLRDGIADPYPANGSKYVNGLVGTITDVDLTLHGFSHTIPQDVDLMLANVSTGRGVVVMSDVGGATPVSGLTLTLDDQAEQALPQNGPPNGFDEYRPANAGSGDSFPSPAPVAQAGAALSGFNGTSGNGAWVLLAVDDDLGFRGTLDGWSVDITTSGVAPYPSTIKVSGAPNEITDVDVVLRGLSHARLDDVDIMLVGPSGAQATILSDVPSVNSPNNVVLTMDDESPAPPSNLTTGSYRPTNIGSNDPFPAPAPGSGSSSLSAFDGSAPNGTWRLFVTDDGTDMTGVLGGWSLRIDAKDSVGPRITSSRPRADASAVSRDVTVTATLSEAVKRATVTTASASITPAGAGFAPGKAPGKARVAATVSYDAATRTVRINPVGRLARRTTYVAAVTSDVRDLADNQLDQSPTISGLQPKVWEFTTR